MKFKIFCYQIGHLSSERVRATLRSHYGYGVVDVAYYLTT